jgi:hypothetical protein
MYRLKLDSPERVITLLRFPIIDSVPEEDTTSDSEEDTTSVPRTNTSQLSAKFLIKLKRYLRGKGHPIHVDISPDVITPEMREAGDGDGVLRATRFLLLATGSDLLQDDLFFLHVSYSKFRIRTL